MSDLIEKGKDLMDNQIIKLNVQYIDFNGQTKTGQIEVHEILSNEVKNIFDDILKSGFQINKINTIDHYGYSDEKSIRDNNSSSYNFRFVGDSNKLSDHSIGFAIDINPWQNPWVHPSALNLTKYDPSVKGTILSDSDIVKIFKKYGWTWGGDWRNPDYQHFFKGGEENKLVKNQLYDDLGIDNPYLPKKEDKPLSKIDRFKDFIRKIKN